MDLALKELAQILGIGIRELGDALSALRRKHAAGDEAVKEQARRERQKAERPIQRRRLRARLLERYYPDSGLAHSGLHRYRFAVEESGFMTSIATKREWLDMGVSLKGRAATFSTSTRKVPKAQMPDRNEAASLLLEYRKRQIPIENNPIFSLQEAVPGHPLRMTFAIERYLDYKLSFGRLEDETSQALVDVGLRLDDLDPSKHLPLRGTLLPDADAIAAFSGRICGGGTNVLLAFRRRDENDYAFYVKRRSKKVSSGRQVLALVPSGMHQPMMRAHAEKQVHLASTVFRETCEELFSKRSINEIQGHLEPDWYMQFPELRWFTQNPKAYEMDLVCLGLNLIDGTYECGVLLAVLDPKYWKRYHEDFQTNLEFKDHTTPTFSTRDQGKLEGLLGDPMCADVSLFALVHGLRRLKQLDKSRVTLPRLEPRLL